MVFGSEQRSIPSCPNITEVVNGLVDEFFEMLGDGEAGYFFFRKINFKTHMNEVYYIHFDFGAGTNAKVAIPPPLNPEIDKFLKYCIWSILVFPLD